ncbi:pre-rRNA-processing protein IPI1, partial [Phenoliferia sp. Uapishka_3]
MPKSNKHKKARVADFAKAKLKLGKGKQVANNATNTSFTTKTIPIPAQSLASTADASTPVSRRSLTLPTLLLQSHHYSPSVRQLALTEILQLLATYPRLLSEHRLGIFGSIERSFEDPIPGIRQSWRKVMKIMFDFEEQEEKEQTGKAGGSAGRMVLRTLSALSSLDEPVRIDGLLVLDMLLERAPAEVVGGWTDGRVGEDGEGEDGSSEDTGAKIVESLLGVLRVRSKGFLIANGTYTTSSTSSDLTPSARLAVLRTMSKFLRAALYPSISSSILANPPWYLRPSYKTARAYSSLANFLSPSTAPQNPLYPLAFPSTSMYTLNSLILPSASTSSTSIPLISAQPRATLLSIVTPTLLSSFLDSAPTAFSPSLEGMETTASESHLATIISVISVARSLFWLELGGVRDLDAEGLGREGERDRTTKTLLSLLGHVGVYFPFEIGGEGGVLKSAEAEDRLLQLNLTFSSLVSLLPTSSAALGPASRRAASTNVKRARKQAEGDEKIDLLVSSVSEWVVSALKGEITTARYPLGIPLSKESYEDLEPTLWELLNRESLSRSSEGHVLRAVLDHFTRISSGETKTAAFVFIARLVLVRLPPLFDFGQSVADALRLQRFKAIRRILGGLRFVMKSRNQTR